MTPKSKKAIELIARFAGNMVAFFAALSISVASGVRRLVEVWAPHQAEWVDALAPALHYLALSEAERRKASIPAVRNYWIEATKGTGKDYVLAACVLWLAAFGKRPLTIEVCAADQEQAAELWKSAKSILYANRWLSQFVSMKNHTIAGKGNGVEAKILTADKAGSHGSRPDLLILNELSHVEKWEYIHNRRDNARKVPHCVTICATNAGFTGTEAYRWRELARTSPRWKFLQFAEPAPWLDPEEVAEAKILGQASGRYARLFWGVWQSGSGDALEEEDIEAAITQDGPLSVSDTELAKWTFVGALDLGIKRDHSAFVVLGVRAKSQRVRLCWVQHWKPPKGGQVIVADVRNHILDVHRRRFHLRRLVFDPSQCLDTAQQLRRAGMVCDELVLSSKSVQDMIAAAMVEMFRLRQIDLYRHPQLIRDLGRISIQENGFGQQRLTAVRDADGHADVGTALAYGLPFAQRLTFTSRSVSREDVVAMHTSDISPNPIRHGVQIGRPNVAAGRGPQPRRQYGSCPQKSLYRDPWQRR
jgi:hypothetical protein